MRTVYILGAGASAGVSLRDLGDPRAAVNKGNVTPPVTNGFFSGKFLTSIGYNDTLVLRGI